MTKEKTKEAIKVMQAYVDGAEIELRSKYNPEDTWETEEPNWTWSKFDYRIKSAPKLRPWKVEEVPFGAWYCTKKDTKTYFIPLLFNATLGYIINMYDDEWTLNEMLQDLLHSLDQGKTWLPCGVEE